MKRYLKKNLRTFGEIRRSFKDHGGSILMKAWDFIMRMRLLQILG